MEKRRLSSLGDLKVEDFPELKEKEVHKDHILKNDTNSYGAVTIEVKKNIKGIKTLNEARQKDTYETEIGPIDTSKKGNFKHVVRVELKPELHEESYSDEYNKHIKQKEIEERKKTNEAFVKIYEKQIYPQGIQQKSDIINPSSMTQPDNNNVPPKKIEDIRKPVKNEKRHLTSEEIKIQNKIYTLVETWKIKLAQIAEKGGFNAKRELINFMLNPYAWMKERYDEEKKTLETNLTEAEKAKAQKEIESIKKHLIEIERHLKLLDEGYKKKIPLALEKIDIGVIGKVFGDKIIVSNLNDYLQTTSESYLMKRAFKIGNSTYVVAESSHGETFEVPYTIIRQILDNRETIGEQNKTEEEITPENKNEDEEIEPEELNEIMNLIDEINTAETESEGLIQKKSELENLLHEEEEKLMMEETLQNLSPEQIKELVEKLKAETNVKPDSDIQENPENKKNAELLNISYVKNYLDEIKALESKSTYPDWLLAQNIKEDPEKFIPEFLKRQIDELETKTRNPHNVAAAEELEQANKAREDFNRIVTLHK